MSKLPTCLQIQQAKLNHVIRVLFRHLNEGIAFYLLHQFIDCIDSKQEFKPHVLDTLTIVRRAWDELSQTTIKNCFQHCGFGASSEIEDTPEFTDKLDIAARLQENLEGDSSVDTVIEEYIHIDDDVEIAPLLECSEIASLVTEKTKTSSEDDNSDDCDIDIVKPSKLEVKGALQVVKNYLLCSDGSVEQIQKYQDLEKFIDSSLAACRHQTQLTDYFK